MTLIVFPPPGLWLETLNSESREARGQSATELPKLDKTRVTGVGPHWLGANQVAERA